VKRNQKKNTQDFRLSGTHFNPCLSVDERDVQLHIVK